MTEKPSEELTRINREKLEAKCEQNDIEGAFYRLTRIMDPNRLNEWKESEYRRGTKSKPGDYNDIIAQLLAQLLIVANSDPKAIMLQTVLHLKRIAAGTHKMTVVEVDVKTGHEYQKTGEGVVREIFKEK